MSTLWACTGRGRSSDGSPGVTSILLPCSIITKPKGQALRQGHAWLSPKLGTKNKFHERLRCKAGQTEQADTDTVRTRDPVAMAKQISAKQIIAQLHGGPEGQDTV